MEDFQETVSSHSSLSLSSQSSSSPIPHPSSPSSFSLSSSSFSSTNPHPLTIDAELWLMAEHRTQEILCIIQPSLVSEEKRKIIIGYFQRLLRGYFCIEVFPFGSVPLKTFLPDGDIDMTVLCHPIVEENLAKYICEVLELEQQDPQFLVQDVQYIHAQVKVIKCTVNNFSVDISFNQMAGMSALCFLEQVDHLVGKDHLFKRSVILIKSWCYYEGRILGAHHGLISTYALETLILYIINFFHSSLCGPLAVLYKFLDYYSTFDWVNYCICLTGPVPISSLSAVAADIPESYGEELLFSQDFLKHFRELFCVPMQSLEVGPQVFPVKHLNIMDPLKENNNLGRSVSEGNFYRIRCAFAYGSQRLAEVLMLPGESMGGGLERYFINTLGRNGRGQRPDVQIPVHAFGSGRYEVCDLSGDFDGYYSDLQYCQWFHGMLVPGLPCSVPSPQTQMECSWDALRQYVMCNQNVLTSRGTNVFIPRPTFIHPSLQSPAATYGFENTTMSRGTCSNIPDWALPSYREIPSWLSTRNPESSTPGLVLSSPKETNPIECSLETGHSGDGDCLDHVSSPKQFPLPPGTERTVTTDQSGQPFLKSTVTTDQSGQPVLKSTEVERTMTTDKSSQNIEVENLCQSLQDIKFGVFEGASPIGKDSPAGKVGDSGSGSSPIGKDSPAGKMAGSGPRSSMPPTTEKQEQEEVRERDEERSAVKPFEVKDDNDFPSLI